MVSRRHSHGLVMSDCDPLRALLLTFAGWARCEQQRAVEYLVEENRALKEQLGGRPRWITDDQRLWPAAKGRVLGRRFLGGSPPS